MSKIIDAIYPRSSRYSIKFQAYARALNLQLTHTYFFFVLLHCPLWHIWVLHNLMVVSKMLFPGRFSKTLNRNFIFSLYYDLLLSFCFDSA